MKLLSSESVHLLLKPKTNYLKIYIKWENLQFFLETYPFRAIFSLWILLEKVVFSLTLNVPCISESYTEIKIK